MNPEHLEVGKIYRCKLRHCRTGKVEEAELIRVDEDDVTWRTADDGSEINEMAWDVIEAREGL